jgi:hypothetical protein
LNSRFNGAPISVGFRPLQCLLSADPFDQLVDCPQGTYYPYTIQFVADDADCRGSRLLGLLRGKLFEEVLGFSICIIPQESRG